MQNYKLIDYAGNELTIDEAIEFLEDIRNIVPAEKMSSNAGLVMSFMDFEEWVNDCYKDLPPFTLLSTSFTLKDFYERYNESVLLWIKVGYFDNFITYKEIN